MVEDGRKVAIIKVTKVLPADGYSQTPKVISARPQRKADKLGKKRSS